MKYNYPRTDLQSHCLIKSLLFSSTIILCLCSPALLRAEQHKYMGVASCSSSNCHGSIAPREATSVLQNEYSTWSKHDAHAQAWLSLTKPESQRIGMHLGIAHPEKEPWCLKCHATYAPASQTDEKFRVEDGVGCESCHGASEKYLPTHTEKEATHARNLQHGLSDIVSPQKRVALCLGCHYGTDDKTVDHKLIGAGHPRLTFELDTFTALEPIHWNIDKDYTERKEAYVPARAWLTGQIVRAQEMLTAMQSQTRSRAGENFLAGPELTLLYCYTCHHSLTEKQWKERTYDGKPGELRLNISSLLIVEQALKALNYSGNAQLIEQIETLHKSNDVKKEAQSIAANLEKAKGFVTSADFNKATSQNLLKALLNYGITATSPPYEVAEQIAMAASSISATQSVDGSYLKREIDQLYTSLEKPEEFQPAMFVTASKLLLEKL